MDAGADQCPKHPHLLLQTPILGALAGSASPPVLLFRSLGDYGPGRWAVTRALHTEACPVSRAPTSACEILIP